MGLRAHMNTLEEKNTIPPLVFIRNAPPSPQFTTFKSQRKLISNMSGALGIKMKRLRK